MSDSDSNFDRVLSVVSDGTISDIVHLVDSQRDFILDIFNRVNETIDIVTQSNDSSLTDEIIVKANSPIKKILNRVLVEFTELSKRTLSLIDNSNDSLLDFKKDITNLNS